MRGNLRILVTGAGGNIGSRVVSRLAAQGVPVRALVQHDDDRARGLRAMGDVQVVAGDLTRAPDVVAALKDCRRLYFGMSVSAQYLEAAATAAVAALDNGSVELLVNMSQMTVSQMGLGSVTESAQQRLHWLAEHVLNWSGLPVTHVRPTMFMENPLFRMLAVATIARDATIRLPFGDARTSPVASRDVSEVVTGLLTDPDPDRHAGRVYELTGAASRDMMAIAGEFSAFLGRPVTYVDVPYQDWLENDLKPLGLAPHVAEHIATMARLCKDNRYDRLTSDVSDLLGRPPSGFDALIAQTPALQGASSLSGEPGPGSSREAAGPDRSGHVPLTGTFGCDDRLGIHEGCERNVGIVVRLGLRARAAIAGGAVALITTGAVLGTLVLAGPASAEPATAVGYPAGSTATQYSGLAFDTCTAPALAAIQAWGASPYRAIGVYIGGVNRTCAQPQLTASWVTAVSRLKWRLLPVYKGLQPSCGGKPADKKIVPSQAAAEGTAAADDAVAKATALGLRHGSAFYNDIENYTATDTACRAAVLAYLSAWTKELHRLGYLAGVYANLSSGAPALSGTYTSASYARPDALWIARYDSNSSLTGWAGVATSQWAVHQRAKQYRGGHDETYGGVTINIDTDNVNAPVATVAYGYTVTSTSTLNARTGPSASSPVTASYLPGSTVQALCQAYGSKVGSTNVWDKLSTGGYVTDYYLSTPSKTGYSAPLPGCSYPYQVDVTTGLSERTGPGTSYPVAANLPNGALAWVTCQGPGPAVGSTKVWDKLTDGHWATDYYIATHSNTTYTPPVPRC